MSGDSAAALIRAKREGRALSAAQWQALARGIADGSWGDGQIGAFAMAVAWRGLAAAECRDFTLALRDSGRRLDWSDLPGPVLDKHSTGGVGDCVSLALAPLVAACGGYVPMISGRGLGHTGGTLDKLESIAGYDVLPDAARLRRVVAEVGCAIVGQSADLVPADRRLYAVRDVSATVDVPELIVASILSKKLAGGAQALVLDIKTGSGAQTPAEEAACALAQRMQQVAAGSGLVLAAALTDMGQVLGRDAGNALELRAILDLLCGRAHCPRLRELVLELSARLLCLGGLAADPAAART
ncbi:MAG: thymidine phosphorylase, partial [Xanthomonadales bacterium]|nr:thymidine phosphorylase [Xanthomonadales bacterium]